MTTVMSLAATADDDDDDDEESNRPVTTGELGGRVEKTVCTSKEEVAGSNPA